MKKTSVKIYLLSENNGDASEMNLNKPDGLIWYYSAAGTVLCCSAGSLCHLL